MYVLRTVHEMGVTVQYILGSKVHLYTCIRAYCFDQYTYTHTTYIYIYVYVYMCIYVYIS